MAPRTLTLALWTALACACAWLPQTHIQPATAAPAPHRIVHGSDPLAPEPLGRRLLDAGASLSETAPDGDDVEAVDTLADESEALEADGYTDSTRLRRRRCRLLRKVRRAARAKIQQLRAWRENINASSLSGKVKRRLRQRIKRAIAIFKAVIDAINDAIDECKPDDPGAAPVITCSEPITVSVSDDAVAITATATDAEDDANGVALEASCQPASTAGLAVGATDATCSVTDSDGNTETCTVAVTVSDDPGAAPVITCPEPITVSVSDDAVAIAATATDAEDDANGVALDVSCQPASTADLNVGSTDATCSVTDSDGNTETCTVAITIAEAPDTVPVITCPEPITVSIWDAAVAITATATDAEDDANGVALAASCQPDSTAGLALGSSETTCSVTDSDGNTETCTAAVTVTGCIVDGPGSFGVSVDPIVAPCGFDGAPLEAVPTAEACAQACAEQFEGAGCIFETSSDFGFAGCFAYGSGEACAAELRRRRNVPCRRSVVFQCEAGACGSPAEGVVGPTCGGVTSSRNGLTLAECNTQCLASSDNSTAVCQFSLADDSSTQGSCTVYTPSFELAPSCAAASCTATEIVCSPGAAQP